MKNNVSSLWFRHRSEITSRINFNTIYWMLIIDAKSANQIQVHSLTLLHKWIDCIEYNVHRTRRRQAFRALSDVLQDLIHLINYLYITNYGSFFKQIELFYQQFCFFLCFNTWVNDVDDWRWSYFFQIFQKYTCVTPVSVWSKDTFGRKVNQFFEVCVHDNFLFIGILQRFASRDGIVTCLKI